MNDSSGGLSYKKGERARIDIPDETDPDFEFPGKNAEIISIIEDQASSVTGDPEDDAIYRVALDVGDVIDVRSRDLRPPI